MRKGRGVGTAPAVLALTACLASGCGSTVRPTTEAGSRPGSSADGSLVLPERGAETSVLLDGTASAASRAEELGASAADGLKGVGDGQSPAARAATVKLGFFISDDASAIYKALGISGASHSREESKAIWQAVLDQVNARGGLAGRRIVPSYFFIDSESGTNATRSQAACQQFTQDERVFAVVIDGASSIAMATCLAQHRTPAIDVGQTSYPYDDTDLRVLAPYLYVPGRLSMSRFAVYVDTLADKGFFAKDSKVGLLRFDLPDQLRTSRDVIKPALRRHGLSLTSDVAFSPVEGTADLPRAANEASAAVLRMRRAGVDRVLFLGSGLSLPYVFPTVAESQGYRPRYGITTDDGPDFMATNVPAAQMEGATAVGWEAQYDVPDSDAVLRADLLWQQCARVVRAAGFTPRDGRRCTAVYFLEQALRGAGEVTPGALRAGADRLGSRPYSTQNYATFFRRGRYDGVSTVRPLRFVASCTCFRYLGGDVPTR